MMAIVRCLVLALACCAASVFAAGADANYQNLSAFIESNYELIAKLGSTPEPAVLFDPFPCELIHRSTKVPKSVHELRPSDIKVIGSIGDSITAAFGAESKNPFQLFNEYRGVSWSGGGQDNYEIRSTLPNIFKKFNPDIYGYATGTGGPNSEQAVFNIAVTGAVAEDLPSQARRLLTLMQLSEKVNFTEDWKVVTVWIGGNDLCAVCNEPDRYSMQKYQEHIMSTLDILLQIPRVYVNLVSMMDITRLNQLDSGLCPTFHSIVCKCVADSEETRRLVSTMATLYQAAAKSIGEMERYQTDTFAVNIQPFFIDTQVPENPDGTPDTTYFAPDCFHFSYKAHYAAAIGLWNNMLEAAGTKSTSWKLGSPPLCPTVQKPYLCTATNECGASSAIFEINPRVTAAPPILSIDQKTMLGLALVLLIAVPTAMVVFLRARRKHREGYTPIDGANVAVTTV